MTVPDTATVADNARGAVDVATWVAIGLGLAFTAVNVQTFAAAGAPAWSLAWSVAWLLDPMVSVLLLAVVRAEQVTARWQVAMPWQVTAVKWSAFLATYLMNTWSSWRDLIPSGVVLHSVPPVFVLLAAEVAPALRDRLTEAVTAASAHQTPVVEPPAPAEPAPSSVDAPSGPASATEPEELEAEVPADTTAAPSDADDGDPRVREIAELLAAGAEVTGPQAAAIHGVSDRTGRRLLADARSHLEQHPIATTGHGLHLVEPHTAGRTA